MTDPSRPPMIFAEELASIERVLEDTLGLARGRSFWSAARRFGELRMELERHLRDEREVVLPFLVARGAVELDRVQAPLNESRVLLSLLEELAAAVSTGELEWMGRCLPDFKRLLRSHLETFDSLVPEDVRAALPDAASWKAFIESRRREERLGHGSWL